MEILVTLGVLHRNVNGAATMENHMVVPQKIKSETALWSSHPTSGCIPEKLKARFQTDICTLMFIAALFMITKRRKQPKHPLKDEWINRVWSIHTMEYHSPLERRKWWLMLQYGWNLKTSCKVKYASHKRTNIAWVLVTSVVPYSLWPQGL